MTGMYERECNTLRKDFDAHPEKYPDDLVKTVNSYLDACAVHFRRKTQWQDYTRFTSAESTVSITNTIVASIMSGFAFVVALTLRTYIELFIYAYFGYTMGDPVPLWLIVLDICVFIFLVSILGYVSIKLVKRRQYNDQADTMNKLTILASINAEKNNKK